MKLIRKIILAIFAAMISTFIWLDTAQAAVCDPGPNRDLSNCDFSFYDLIDADLTGSDLTNANFSNADLTNAKLQGATVTGARFSTATLTSVSSGGLLGSPNSMPASWKVTVGYIVGPTANLTNAILTNGNLSGTSLASATLTGLKTGNITGSPSLPANWIKAGTYLVGPSANLNDANLSGLNLTAFNLSGASFRDANLTRAVIQSTNFSNADLSGANLSSTGLSNTLFTNANLTNANFNGTFTSGTTYMLGSTLDGIKSGNIRFYGLASPSDFLLPSSWSVINGYIVGPKADLTNADLSNSRLINTDLSGANLTNVRSGGIFGTPAALPDGWRFVKKYLVGPTANLTGAGLSYADLTGLSLQSANLTNASLFSANLSGVDLANAILDGINSGAISSGPSSLPSNWQFRSGFLVGPKASFTDVLMDSIDLSNSNLSGATFTRVRLDGTNLSGANLSEVTISGGTFLNTDLSSATLDNSTITNANIAGANFTGSSLNGIRSSGLFGAPTLTSDWVVRSGILLGPGANISGYSLPGFDFSNTNLTDVNFASTVLINAKSGHITGTPKNLPSNWTLQNGYLVGPQADLTNADLTNVNLEYLANSFDGLKISGANFTNARIGRARIMSADLRTNTFKGAYLAGLRCEYCDLTGVDLSGADLTGAQLFVAKLSGSNLKDADLTNANLDSAKLVNANLEGTVFTSATMNGITSGEITGSPIALPSGWRLSAGYLIGSGADLSNANLNQADLSELSLTGVTLTGAQLSSANLTKLKMSGIVGTPSSVPASWKVSKGILIGPDAKLSDLDLSGISITNVSLRNADLTGVYSRSIVGSTVELPPGWLLFRGQLVGPGANLTDATLTGANLGNVSLSGSTLNGVTSGLVTGVPLGLPDKWRLVAGYLVGPKARLVNADLSDQNLTGSSIQDADFTGAILRGVITGNLDGYPAHLPITWKVVSGYFVGPGANLDRANFDSADLGDVNLQGTDLSTATLDNVMSGNVAGTPSALPTGWGLVRGYLVGPKANLESANLSRGTLTDLDLSGANLKWANLTSMTITRVNFEGTNLEGAYLGNSTFVDSNINQGNFESVGCFCNLVSSGLTGSPAKLPDDWVLVGGALQEKVSGVNFPALGEAKVGTTVEPQLSSIPVDSQLAYQWYDGDNQITGETRNGLSLVASLLDHNVSVRVTISKAGFANAILRSAPVKVIPGTLSYAAPRISGQLAVGNTLSLEAQTMPIEVQKSIQWLINGQPKVGAIGNSFLCSSESFNQTVSARITYSRLGFNNLVVETAGVKIGVGTPIAQVPKISGTVKVGKVVTTLTSAWAPGASIKYQWTLDGKAIKGATLPTYKLLAAQKGHKLAVQVTQNAIGYTTVSKTSLVSKVG